MAMESFSQPASALPFSVVIVAGGSGTRLGGDIPKQYVPIAGKTILDQCISVFRSCPGLKHIVLVCDPAHADLVHDTVQRFGLTPPAPCGKTRKQSVYNGLKALNHLKSEDIVLIHDAARPLVTRAEIEAVVKTVDKSGAATLATPVADTIRRADAGLLGESIPRENLWSIQTPQGFRYRLILAAHDRFADDDNFTDDTGLASAAGHTVEIVPGNRENFKITTPGDMAMAEKLLFSSSRTETRTGFGFDIHAFDLGSPGPVTLGGVKIPHPHKLLGHSDADAGLHALTDALLSTIAAGDIGTHFPPSDPQWKGMDSVHFLKHAAALVQAKGGRITLLDLTFLCEAPKIGPHREAMQQVIAASCAVHLDRVSIKATTMEKLGSIGRAEGIAAQALATVEFPVSQ